MGPAPPRAAVLPSILGPTVLTDQEKSAHWPAILHDCRPVCRGERRTMAAGRRGRPTCKTTEAAYWLPITEMRALSLHPSRYGYTRYSATQPRWPRQPSALRLLRERARPLPPERQYGRGLPLLHWPGTHRSSPRPTCSLVERERQQNRVLLQDRTPEQLRICASFTLLQQLAHLIRADSGPRENSPGNLPTTCVCAHDRVAGRRCRRRAGRRNPA